MLFTIIANFIKLLEINQCSDKIFSWNIFETPRICIYINNLYKLWVWKKVGIAKYYKEIEKKASSHSFIFYEFQGIGKSVVFFSQP